MRAAAAAALLLALPCTASSNATTAPTTQPAAASTPPPTLRPTLKSTAAPTRKTSAPTPGPTAVPTTAAPTGAPTGAPTLGLNAQRNSWGFVLGVVQLYALAMVLLLVFREAFRKRAYVYASRRQLTSTRLAKLGQRATGLERHARPVGGACDWARRSVSCPDMALIELHGLDAYACCSFLALCARLAAFCCALGCCVLLPIYYWAARPLEDSGLAAADTAARQRAAFARVTLGAVATDATHVFHQFRYESFDEERLR